MDVDASLVAGLLGFAIERTDHTEGTHGHLNNFLLFKANDVGPDPDHSSQLNPVQAFVWGDYTAKPDHTYTYTITAMRGQPGQLERGPAATVRTSTEDPDDGTHGVFFNRSVVASQAYQQRFGQSRRPTSPTERPTSGSHAAWRKRCLPSSAKPSTTATPIGPRSTSSSTTPFSQR
jgi:hypothetical protein